VTSSPGVSTSFGRKVATLCAISPRLTTMRISALSHDFGGTTEPCLRAYGPEPACVAANAGGARRAKQQATRRTGRRIRCSYRPERRLPLGCGPMEPEIRPEPTPEERAAILAALEQLFSDGGTPPAYESAWRDAG